jgi:hypothetical protein
MPDLVTRSAGPSQTVPLWAIVSAGLSSVLASLGIATSPEPPGGSTPQHIAWTSLGRCGPHEPA